MTSHSTSGEEKDLIKDRMSEEITIEERTKGRALFGPKTQFMLSVFKLEDLPPCDLPEIAFAGRSNVGKSSLINALTGISGLAKTSNTPGRTQSLNFFNQGGSFYLVDMPGYGYAKAPKKVVEGWQKLIRTYLLGRVTLRRVYVLVDSRHGAKENDLQVMKLLDECAISYQIVLTKGDKISPIELLACKETITKSLIQHTAAFPVVLTTSSEKLHGLDELRAAISHVISV